MILREEMRRTLASLDHFSRMWEGRGCASSLVCLSRDPVVSEGLTAYAEYQSHVFRSLHDRFKLIWDGLEKEDNPITEPVSVASEETLLGLQGDDL